jgi:hypothetical protein
MFRATFRRLLALDDPPERTALAFSIGVFIAFSPFLGLHAIMATLVAFLFRIDKIAVYSGTFINNPLPNAHSNYHCLLRRRGFYSRTPAANPGLRNRTAEAPSPFNCRLLSQAVSRKLGRCLALRYRLDDAFGGLFAHGLSSNIIAVAVS